MEEIKICELCNERLLFGKTTFTIIFFKIAKLDDCPLFDQEYSFQITMRQQWNDKRLAYKERLQGQLAGNNYDHSYWIIIKIIIITIMIDLPS